MRAGCVQSLRRRTRAEIRAAREAVAEMDTCGARHLRAGHLRRRTVAQTCRARHFERRTVAQTCGAGRLERRTLAQTFRARHLQSTTLAETDTWIDTLNPKRDTGGTGHLRTRTVAATPLPRETRPPRLQGREKFRGKRVAKKLSDTIVLRLSCNFHPSTSGFHWELLFFFAQKLHCIIVSMVTRH